MHLNKWVESRIDQFGCITIQLFKNIVEINTKYQY